MKKIRNLCNIVMGGFTGTLIGYSLYILWDYRAHPLRYAVQSAPWYTGIVLYGALTLAVLLVCAVVKGICRCIQKKRRQRHDTPEDAVK